MRHTVERLDNLTLAQDFWDDQDAAQKVLRERTEAQEMLEKLERFVKEIPDLVELLDMAVEAEDEALAQEVAAAIPPLEQGVRELELKRMLAGPEDRSDAILQVHPGAGGVDAQDWAEMLLRMYLRYCERRGFKVDLIDRQPGDEAGIKDAQVLVRGPYAYGFLRAESGVHRLIRISPFDSNARRHTAFAAVTVVPDLEDDVAEVELKDDELEWQTMRSGGAGGQHVNKTESAVRLTHIPTGMVVKCQAERSQHQNRATAIKILRGLLYERARREREAAYEAAYESGKKAIDFGSQVRTYTLHPYTLVKDERTDYKTGNVDAVLEGDLHDFIEAFLMKNAEQRTKEPPSQVEQKG